MGIITIIAFMSIMLSAREVYYRETLGNADKGASRYWMSITYTGLMPATALATDFDRIAYGVFGILLMLLIIEHTHEAVDEGYFRFLEQQKESLRPDKMELPMFGLEESLHEFLTESVTEK